MHLFIFVCRHFNEVDSSLREGTWDNLLQGTKYFFNNYCPIEILIYMGKYVPRVM